MENWKFENQSIRTIKLSRRTASEVDWEKRFTCVYIKGQTPIEPVFEMR